jgi:secreted protein with Ig-like and vWFA domain
MNLTPDDPRLTAAALDELGPEERAELEAALAASPAAQRELDEIRATAGLLREALAAEPLPEMAGRPVPLEFPSDPPAPAVVPVPDNVAVFPRRAARPWLWAAATVVLLGVLAGLLLPPLATSRKRAMQLTRVETTEVPAPSAATPPAGPAATAKPDQLSESTPPAAAAGAAAEFFTDPLAARAGYVQGSTTPADGGVTPLDALGRNQAAPNVALDNSADAGARSLSSAQPSPPALTPDLASRYGLARSPAQPAAPVPEIALMKRYGLALPATPASPQLERERLLAEGRGAAPALAFKESAERQRPLPALQEAEVRYQRELLRRGEDANPGYVDLVENAFLPALAEPLSTFGLDVDTGSYANLRRFLKAGQLPPPGAVRLEEIVNYFPYAYAEPRGEHPFGVQVETASAPWAPQHRLVRIALRGRGLGGARPPSSFVFLVDVSGSMQPEERLPLLKQALRALVKRMAPTDRVALVTYASSAGVALPSTSCERVEVILEAIDGLAAGGSTNGEGGLRAAYDEARRHFIPGGVNRVLLCTDGDFNVGVSDQDELVKLIEEQAKSGVHLTTLGVGTDNYKDALMRRLADQGNGNYAYLDSFEEAQRVLVEQMDATFVTIAQDVKAQVEFNPARAGAWRLLGYEKRALAHQDFNDDRKDAGEIGAGHTVTVLYEVIPPGVAPAAAPVDGLKYQRPAAPAAAPAPAAALVPSDELLTLKLRYKRPGEAQSRLLEFAVKDDGRRFEQAGADFRFAAAAAGFAMMLRDSPHRGTLSFGQVSEIAAAARGADPGGWRAEFLTLVKKAQELRGGR